MDILFYNFNSFIDKRNCKIKVRARPCIALVAGFISTLRTVRQYYQQKKSKFSRLLEKYMFGGFVNSLVY